MDAKDQTSAQHVASNQLQLAMAKMISNELENHLLKYQAMPPEMNLFFLMEKFSLCVSVAKIYLHRQKMELEHKLSKIIEPNARKALELEIETYNEYLIMIGYMDKYVAATSLSLTHASEKLVTDPVDNSLRFLSQMMKENDSKTTSQ